MFVELMTLCLSFFLISGILLSPQHYYSDFSSQKLWLQKL
jgi:hypothetical protein